MKFIIEERNMFNTGCGILCISVVLPILMSLVPAHIDTWFGFKLPPNMQDTTILVNMGYILAVIGVVLGILNILFSLNIDALLGQEEMEQ